jgi:hypothetical protein
VVRVPKYLISWDNGADACGTFPWVYDDYDKAVREAEDFAEEMKAEGVRSEEGGCEVIEMPTTATGPPAHAIEGTVDHFGRYIAGDR